MKLKAEEIQITASQIKAMSLVGQIGNVGELDPDHIDGLFEVFLDLSLELIEQTKLLPVNESSELIIKKSNQLRAVLLTTYEGNVGELFPDDVTQLFNVIINLSGSVVSMAESLISSHLAMKEVA